MQSQRFELDRFAIEEKGHDPSKLALEVHSQLGVTDGPVPIVDIAYSLDIKDINIKPLNKCEGALITLRNKSVGSIAVSDRASPRRRRFTIAHELGHFLHVAHKPLREADGFLCSREDMRQRAKGQRAHLTPYQKQEAQANRFAAEILMPRYKLRATLKRPPALQRIIELANVMDVSKEAAANRYIECHGDRLAILFTKRGRVRYVSKTNDFPRTRHWNDDKISHELLNFPETLSELEEVNPEDWLNGSPEGKLMIQTLPQANDCAMVLLIYNGERYDEDIGFETSYERISRF